MNTQLIPIIVLFVLVAGAYYFIHKHASNKDAHPPTVHPPEISGGGGNGGETPIKQK